MSSQPSYLGIMSHKPGRTSTKKTGKQKYTLLFQIPIHVVSCSSHIHPLEPHIHLSSNLCYFYHSNFIAHFTFCNRWSLNEETCATTKNTTTEIFMSCATGRYNQERSTSYKQNSAIWYAFHQVLKYEEPINKKW